MTHMTQLTQMSHKYDSRTCKDEGVDRAGVAFEKAASRQVEGLACGEDVIDEEDVFVAKGCGVFSEGDVVLGKVEALFFVELRLFEEGKLFSKAVP